MSDYFWGSMRALCPDGRMRKVRVRLHAFDGSLACDTFFSCPARVTLGKRTITGYVTRDDEVELAFRDHNRHCVDWSTLFCKV